MPRDHSGRKIASRPAPALIYDKPSRNEKPKMKIENVPYRIFNRPPCLSAGPIRLSVSALAASNFDFISGGFVISGALSIRGARIIPFTNPLLTIIKTQTRPGGRPRCPVHRPEGVGYAPARSGNPSRAIGCVWAPPGRRDTRRSGRGSRDVSSWFGSLPRARGRGEPRSPS